MATYFTSALQTPVGCLHLVTDRDSLVRISFADPEIPASDELPPVMKAAIQQLEEYFSGKRETFELCLNPAGTAFQKKTWDAVRQVKYGQTATYLDIAAKTGSKNNTRAVGAANGKNPLPIVIPCHRIIGSRGQLTGYSGGVEIKRWLLLHEKKYAKSNLLLF